MSFLPYKKDKIYYIYERLPYAAKDGVVVFIHTNVTDHTLFDSVYTSFKRDYDILRYDLRGFGKSNLSEPKDVSIETYVEDLHYLVTSLNMTTLHLVGIGTGALIALKFSRLHQQFVRSLVLLSMPCNPPELIADIQEHRVKISNGGTDIPVDYILSITTNLPEDHFEVARLRNIMSHSDPFLYSRVMDLAVSSEPIKDLRKIDVRTMIISGDNDIVFPQHYLALNAVSLPNVLYETIPNAPNLFILEKPDLVGQLILDFIFEESKNHRHFDPFLEFVNRETLTYTENISDKENTFNEKRTPELRVDLLNTFRVFVNGKEILDGWNRRYSKQILIYLILNSPATREHLCDALWPEVDTHQLRRNLTVYLSYLKKLIKPADYKDTLLITDHEHIHLNVNVTSDLLSFLPLLQQAVKENNAVKKFNLGQKLLQQLNPNFLNATYDNWFVDLRYRIENGIIELALWMANYLLELGKHNQAKRHLEDCLILLDENEEIINKIDKISRQED